MAPSHVIIVIVWTFKMWVWIKLWSDVSTIESPTCSFVPFIGTVITRVFIINFLILVVSVVIIIAITVVNFYFVTIIVALHFIIKLVWVNTFPFLGIINFHCMIEISSLLSSFSFQSLVFKVFWHKSCDHVLIHITIFDCIWSAVNNFFFLVGIIIIPPVSILIYVFPTLLSSLFWFFSFFISFFTFFFSCFFLCLGKLFLTFFSLLTLSFLMTLLFGFLFTFFLS